MRKNAEKKIDTSLNLVSYIKLRFENKANLEKSAKLSKCQKDVESGKVYISILPPEI